MPDESSNFRSDATRPHHPLSQQADNVFFRGQAAGGVQVRKTRVMGDDACIWDTFSWEFFWVQLDSAERLHYS